MKKIVGLLMILALTVGTLAACSNDTPDDETTKSTDGVTQETESQGEEETKSEDGTEQSDVLDGEGTKLTVMAHSSWVTDAAKAVFDYVSEEYNVEFEIEEVPEGDSGTELILARMQSGEVPDILWWQGANAIEQNIGIEEFTELSGDWTKDYSDSILQSANNSIDGKLYSTPFGDLTAFGIIYNKQVFADNNVAIPESWDELLDASKTFAEAGITPVYISGTTDNEWTLQILAIDGRLKQELTSEGSIEALNTNKKNWADMEYMSWLFNAFNELNEAGYIQDTVLSDSYADAQEALLTGQAAMYPQATWIYGELVKLAESDEELNNIGFFPIPSKDGDNTLALVETPTGFAVPKKGNNVDLAKEIVGKLSSKESMTKYYNVNMGIPSVQGVDLDLVGIPSDVVKLMEDGKTATIPGNVYAVPSLGTNVQAMLAGDMTPEQVLEGYDADWDTFAKDRKNPDWGY